MIMKKAIIILFLLGLAHSGYSQEAKKHKFTHSLTENVGMIFKFNLEGDSFYPSVTGGYSLLNFIPSYELGYNNMFFLKLKYRNLENETNHFYYGGYYRSDAYSVLISYNLLKKTSSNSLKIGFGYSLLNVVDKSLLPSSYYENYQKNFVLAEFSYTYKVTSNFAFGFDIDLYQILFFTELSFALTYTF